jgi:hypothetical protein
VSKVTWHDPVAYQHDPEANCENISERNEIVSPKDETARKIEHSLTGTDRHAFDFALLQFDAPVAYLDMELIALLPPSAGCKHDLVRGEAAIIFPDGHIAGSMICSGQFLHEKFNVDLSSEKLSFDPAVPSSTKRYQAELVYLSFYEQSMNVTGFCQTDYAAKAGRYDWHAPGCQYSGNVNLMLIEWDKDHRIAYRIGLTSVRESVWSKVQTHSKRIILA